MRLHTQTIDAKSIDEMREDIHIYLCYCFGYCYLHPFTRIAARIQKVGFRRSFFGLMIIFPTCRFGQTHEDGFNATTGLESENGSPIEYQIEFHVAATTQLLPSLLFFRKGIILVLFNNGSVRRHDVIDGIATEFQNVLRIPVVQVVKENATQSAAFSAVFN